MQHGDMDIPLLNLLVLCTRPGCYSCLLFSNTHAYFVDYANSGGICALRELCVLYACITKVLSIAQHTSGRSSTLSVTSACLFGKSWSIKLLAHLHHPPVAMVKLTV